MKWFYKFKSAEALALVITIIIFLLSQNFISHLFYPYVFIQKASTLTDSITLPVSKFYYHDLNKDSESEKIVYSIEDKNMFCKVILEKFNKTIIEQYNFDGLFPNIFKPILFDINNNGTDDVLMFHILRDSLFLNFIDINSEAFLKKNIFILSKPDSVEKAFWDLDISSICFIDVNNDGHKDFVFSVIARYARYPRTIVALDLKNFRVINKIEFGLYVDKILDYDVDKDGNVEFLISNSSRNNYPQPIGYHDKIAWHFIIDKNFNILTPNYPLGNIYSRIKYYKYDDKVYAFFVWSLEITNNYDIIYEVQKDFSLKEVKRTNLIKDIFPLINSSEGKWVSYLHQNNLLVILDENFNQIYEYKFDVDAPRYIRVVEDANDDGLDDIVLFEENKLYLFDQQLNILAELKLEDKSNRFDHTFNQFVKIDNKVYFFAQTSLYGLGYEFKSNPISKYSSVFLLFGTILLYLLNYFIIKSLIYFFIYFNYFLHSFRKSNTGLIVMNSSGIILFANSQIQKFFSFDEKSLRKKFVLDIFNQQDEIKDAIDKSLKSGRDYSENFYYSTPDYQINGKVITTPFRFFSLIIIGYLVEIENFTEAIMQDRVKVWAKYVQKIAHDIKTPLSAITLGIENIKNQLAKKNLIDNELNEDFNRILAQTQKIQSSTKNILQLSNLELTNFQVCYLDRIIDDSLEKFHNKLKSNSITLIKNFNLDSAATWADPAQLIQVFQIIIENAIDAIGKNGEIKISAYLNDLKNSLIVEIFDSGCGIKPELKNKIFSPYLTTKHDGTGIGLYIAKMIIEAHNGKIYFDSQLDKGTIFAIKLPHLQKSEVLKND
jgi:nitrogen-specific signal transduction histidine kinase